MNIGWLCKDVVLSQGSDAAVDIGKTHRTSTSDIQFVN